MIGIDVSELVSSLHRDLGDDAPVAARDRADNLRSHGDDHGAALWLEVEKELDRMMDAAE